MRSKGSFDADLSCSAMCAYIQRQIYRDISEPTPTRGVDVDTIERCSSSPSESRSLTDAHEEVLFFQYG